MVQSGIASSISDPTSLKQDYAYRHAVTNVLYACQFTMSAVKGRPLKMRAANKATESTIGNPAQVTKGAGRGQKGAGGGVS
jgi:hypothetical protein